MRGRNLSWVKEQKIKLNIFIPTGPPALLRQFLLSAITISTSFFFEITGLGIWPQATYETMRMMVWFQLGRLNTDPSFKKKKFQGIQQMQSSWPGPK